MRCLWEARSVVRVAHVTTVHDPFDPRIFHKQLGSLQETGFDTHLIAPRVKEEDRRNGVTIHALPEPSNRATRLALQPNVFRTARSLDADLYQIHDPELIPLAYLLKKSTVAPVVYDMHENYRTKGALLGRALRLLERWCFRWVDHVLLAEKSYRSIIPSNVSNTLIENYFKPIGNETGVEKRGGPNVVSAPTQLLYTGTISDRRGLSNMVDLAGTVRKEQREEALTLVGICRYPGQREKTERRIREENLEEIVDRIGWNAYVPASTMPPYYRRADVGLALCEPHPNLTGSLLTKFYEYLHYGLPIICSDFPLWRDFIQENGCGAVVPPGDSERVLEVLTRWQENPAIYRERVRNARAAASKYRWEKMAKRLVQVYKELLLPVD